MRPTVIEILLLIATIIFTGCNEESSENTFQTTVNENQTLTLASLEKIDNHPFYSMTYHGDYGFADYLNSGNHPSATFEGENTITSDYWACTCFATMDNNQNMVFGRNFDWMHRGSLLIFTDPPTGYASVSMVDIHYLGYDEINSPDSPKNRIGLLNAPFYPFDGMNEHGVTIALMAVSSANPPVDPDKKTIYTLDVIRLVLDYAKNTNEAVSLIQKYNISMPEPACHYLIADPSGASVIIEFVNNQMVVIENQDQWQVCTNFIVHGSEAPMQVSCWRYNTVYHTLKGSDGNITTSDAMNILNNVAQSNTMWSTVYDMVNKTVKVSVGRNYNKVYEFDSTTWFD
jgi:predicted choloylglycine hydrolase